MPFSVLYYHLDTNQHLSSAWFWGYFFFVCLVWGLFFISLLIHRHRINSGELSMLSGAQRNIVTNIIFLNTPRLRRGGGRPPSTTDLQASLAATMPTLLLLKPGQQWQCWHGWVSPQYFRASFPCRSYSADRHVVNTNPAEKGQGHGLLRLADIDSSPTQFFFRISTIKPPGDPCATA